MDGDSRWRATILGAVALVCVCATVSAVCASVWLGERAPAVIATVATSTVLVVGQIVLLGYQLRHAEDTRRAHEEWAKWREEYRHERSNGSH